MASVQAGLSRKAGLQEVEHVTGVDSCGLALGL